MNKEWWILNWNNHNIETEVQNFNPNRPAHLDVIHVVEYSELARCKEMAGKLADALSIAKRDLESVTNIDHGKLKNLANATLNDIVPVLKEFAELKGRG